MDTAREFKARLVVLHCAELVAMCDFILALAEFDRRKLYRDLGHASLFSFLTVELKLSAGAAQYRKTAAELVQKYPQVETALRDGRLCLSSVIQLAKVVTPENVDDVLPRFYGLSARDAAEVAVSIRPVERAPKRDVLVPVRPVSVPQAVTGPVVELPTPLALRTSEVPAAAQAAPDSLPTSAPSAAPADPAPALALAPSSVRPLDADHSRLSITVSKGFLRKLEAAGNALSHARPGASREEILEAALDALLAERARRRGVGAKPRKTAPPADPATITAEVKREVMDRSGGRCEWVFESGKRCNSPVRTEFNHSRARALGGAGGVDNVDLFCRAHNDLAARQVLGDALMDRFTGRRGAP